MTNSCENVEWATQQTSNILKRVVLDLNAHILLSDPETHVFLFSVRDWLAHLISESYWWQDYSWSLKAAIDDQVSQQERLTGPDPYTKQLINQIVGAPLDVPTLLYRHYLTARVFNEEIVTSLRYTPLYSLMATMLTSPVVFAPLTKSELWEGIDTDPHPINVLRQKRLLIGRFAHQLAMREDLTDHQITRDHGLLSSLTLLYGLHLTCVILIHEVVVRSDQDLRAILTSVSSALADLKGVFNNVERPWLIPHV